MNTSEPAESTRRTRESATTPQSMALRRQQYWVGIAGALLVGVAIALSIIQRFPDVHLAVPLAAGLVGTIGIGWLISKSVFPGRSELTET